MSETVKPSTPPVIVKKYANRRLYNTETSSYITLDNLAEMVRKNRDFVVYDAKNGEDITRSVLTQIIVEEEGKGAALLPTNFLRQLIGMYGTDMPSLIPKYLDQAMASFLQQQQAMRETVSKTFGPFIPPGMEDMGRKNMQMMERAMNLFTPFYREGAEAHSGQDSAHDYQEEILNLRAEIERLQAELAAAKSKGRA
ncbi:MAG: polyhydroxyalkanoate synthesis repressor PhaR [Rhodospirillales bacterium]|nr:polyhydroxyalkanoate synthesis repressor PhaR [Rhodospirillales bacterium]